MESMPSFETEPVGDVQTIRGIRFPADVNFRQLLITDPPGSGNSTLVERIGGWPEEGYIDLSLKRWWTSNMLSLRPREIHLGIPFVGFREALTIFDRDWKQAHEHLVMDVSRIVIPRRKSFSFLIDWRHKYVSDFVLPPAEQVFEQRLIRARRKTHRVDEEFDLALVERQLETM